MIPVPMWSVPPRMPIHLVQASIRLCGVLFVIGFGVLTADPMDLPGFPWWVWSSLYATAGVAMALWTWQLWERALAVSGMALFVASFARAGAFIIWTDRYSGTVLNAMVAVLAALMVVLAGVATEIVKLRAAT